jgi:hypothetical protein
MMEMPVTFFSLVTLLLAARTLEGVRSGDNPALARHAIPLGISCGLAVSTKLNALLIPVVVVLWGALLLLARIGLAAFVEPRAGFRALAGQLRETGLAKVALVALGCVGFVFLASNPLLYHQPLSGTRRILALGSLVASYDVPREQRLDTLPRRVAQIAETGLHDSGPIRRWLGWPLVDAGLASLGIALLIAGALSPRAGPRRFGYAMFLAWFCVTVLGTLAWVPFRWERWYLPLEPCWAIAEAMGVAAIARRSAAFVRVRRAKRNPSWNDRTLGPDAGARVFDGSKPGGVGGAREGPARTRLLEEQRTIGPRERS